MNIHDVAKYLSLASPSCPICLVGPPGVGKSDIVAQHAAATGRALIIMHPAIDDPTDYRGIPAVVGDHAEWLPAGQLRCLLSDEPLLVLLDDVGQAPLAVQAALMQLILARRLGNQAIGPNVTFILATNRADDKSGARTLLGALRNRVVLLPVEADADAWSAWALLQKGIAPAVAAYGKFRADCFTASVPEGMVAYCTPRSLAMAGRLIDSGMRDLSVLAGTIGEATAADLIAYLEVADTLPNVDDLFARPQAWKVPKKDMGLLHAVTVLAARRSPDERIFDLAAHIGEEWGMTLISQAVAVDAAIKNTKAFKSWAVNHKDCL